MKKSVLQSPSSPKYAIDKRTGKPWVQSEDPWEQNLVWKTEGLTNSQKIKTIIDTQVELLFKKSASSKILDGRELQTLVTCTDLMKTMQELDREIAKEQDLSKLSSEELKSKLG